MTKDASYILTLKPTLASVRSTSDNALERILLLGCLKRKPVQPIKAIRSSNSRSIIL